MLSARLGALAKGRRNGPTLDCRFAAGAVAQFAGEEVRGCNVAISVRTHTLR